MIADDMGGHANVSLARQSAVEKINGNLDASPDNFDERLAPPPDVLTAPLPTNIKRRIGSKNVYGVIEFEGIRKYFSLGTNDVDEAKRVLQKKIDEAWDDHLDGRDRVTFSRQFNYIFPRRWANLKSAAWQQQMHDNIVEALGDFYLDEVSEDWCWLFTATRREVGLPRSGVNHLPIGDSTINKEMVFVKRVMLTVDEDRVKMPKKKQVDQKEAPTYPIVKIKRLKSAELVTNPLRDEEEAFELLAKVVPHARPVVLTAVMSGLRRENGMPLDIRDNLLWNGRQIKVKQKGDKDHLHQNERRPLQASTRCLRRSFKGGCIYLRHQRLQLHVLHPDQQEDRKTEKVVQEGTHRFDQEYF
jgi:hypothetical protein